MGNNIRYFISYQTYWMYLRYFFWNFSGKQNDLQGFGNIRDGNAITGIPATSPSPTPIGSEYGGRGTCFEDRTASC